LKKILGKLRRAIDDFNMIQDGDKIAVGLSGGKDSTLLLQAGIKENIEERGRLIVAPTQKYSNNACRGDY
jgi:PP-loop superfamily ATP-utilizing enzyme